MKQAQAAIVLFANMFVTICCSLRGALESSLHLHHNLQKNVYLWYMHVSSSTNSPIKMCLPCNMSFDMRTNVFCKREALAIVIVLSGHCKNAPSSPATQGTG